MAINIRKMAWEFLAPFKEVVIIDNERFKLTSKNVSGSFTYELTNKMTGEDFRDTSESNIVPQVEELGVGEDEFKVSLFNSTKAAVMDFEKTNSRTVNFYYVRKLLKREGKGYCIAKNRAKDRILSIQNTQDGDNAFYFLYLKFEEGRTSILANIELGDGEVIKYSKRESLNSKEVMRTLGLYMSRLFDEHIKSPEDVY